MNKLFRFGNTLKVQSFNCKSPFFSSISKRNFSTEVGFFKKWDFRKFGKVGIYTYLLISASTFTTFYLLFKHNYLSKEKAIQYLESKGYDPQKYISKFGVKTVNFGLAYTCLFVTKPIRAILTVFIAGFLSKKNVNVIAKNTENLNKNTSIIKRYGKAGLIIYTVYWIGTGLTFYYLIRQKYIDKEQIISKIKGTWLEGYYNKIHEKVGDKNTDIAIAYLINAVFEVVRLPTFILFMKLFF